MGEVGGTQKRWDKSQRRFNISSSFYAQAVHHSHLLRTGTAAEEGESSLVLSVDPMPSPFWVLSHLSVSLTPMQPLSWVSSAHSTDMKAKAPKDCDLPKATVLISGRVRIQNQTNGCIATLHTAKVIRRSLCGTLLHSSLVTKIGPTMDLVPRCSEYPTRDSLFPPTAHILDPALLCFLQSSPVLPDITGFQVRWLPWSEGRVLNEIEK